MRFFTIDQRECELAGRKAALHMVALRFGSAAFVAAGAAQAYLGQDLGTLILQYFAFLGGVVLSFGAFNAIGDHGALSKRQDEGKVG